ncbi:Rz1-like lysis system protein LysC [Chromobacterium sp. CV08]|uniref:Rz1-like lysis system protein LysC n=1 Tax=Chromobacterium sp. CV08 TaxID=3133274 RepID=UPI003DA9B23B
MRFEKAPPIEAVPTALLQPSAAPPFNVLHWGDYPIYVEQLHLALKRCNADKAAIAALLNIKTRMGLGGQ